MVNRTKLQGASCAFAVLMIACGCAMPKPETLVTPAARHDGGGEFLSPYRADGSLTPWADKGVHTSRAGADMAAGMAGAAMSFIPFADLAANATQENMKRDAAVKASGGDAYMRSNTESSFDQRSDFSIYLYILSAGRKDYKDVMTLMSEIYPDMWKHYEDDVRAAKRKPKA